MKKNMMILVLLNTFLVSTYSVSASKAYNKCMTDAMSKSKNDIKNCAKGNPGKKCRQDVLDTAKKDKQACEPIKKEFKAKMDACTQELKQAKIEETACHKIMNIKLEEGTKACTSNSAKDAKQKQDCISDVANKRPEFRKEQENCIAKALPKVKEISEKCKNLSKE